MSAFLKILHLPSLAIALLYASLLGCSQESPDQLLASAKSYLADKDTRTAVIQLKNVLQKDPNLAEARFLYGKILLDGKDPAAAAIELRRAADLKYPPNIVVPLLARALFDSGASRKVIDLDVSAALTTPEAIADLKTTVALAHAGTGDNEKANAAIAAALSANPSHAPALLYRARRLAANRDFEGAAKITDDVLRRTPDDVEALILKGDVLRFKNDQAGSLALYRQALATKPDDVTASTALVEQLLLQNDLEGATTAVGAMKKAHPGHPNTVYFQARLAAQNGDLATAEELAQQLLKSAPEDIAVLHLAGVIALQRGNAVVAQARLSKLVQKVPNAPIARQLLARAYLRAGDPTKAMETLDSLLQSTDADTETLNVAAGASLLIGDYKKSQDLFARAARLKPAGAHGGAGAAVARILGGDAQGLRDLQVVAGADTGTDSDMTLISALVSRRDYDGALKAIDRLEVKSPGKPLAPFLRGQTLMLRGDLVTARANLEKALAADPRYYPAIDRLAVLDWREKKPDAARERFKAVLKINPDDVRAMVGLANLEEQAGTPKQEVAALLAKAVSIKPTDASLRRRLVSYYLDKQEPKLALNAAQTAVAALPNEPEILALLAKAQLTAGEINQAISSYGALASLQPRSPAPLLGLADAHLANKSFDAAADATRRASALAPNSPLVAAQAARVDILSGRFDAALARARTVQSRSPKSAQGFVIEGDVEYARHNWEKAVTAYRAALQRQPDGALAQRLYLALRATGNHGKADAFAAEWMKGQPKDPRFPFFLAGVSIRDKKYDAAETQLKQVLSLDPDNATAVNNLAWVLWSQNKPGALEAAERANQLAPNQPVMMDTLATVLASQGQLPRALELQKKAVELDPKAGGLRLALARLYLKSGDKGKARGELSELAKLGEKFAQQGEVQELLRQL